MPKWVPRNAPAGLAKWPRDYAAEIAALDTRQKRRAALERVPVEYREWVKRLVVMAFEKRAFR